MHIASKDIVILQQLLSHRYLLTQKLFKNTLFLNICERVMFIVPRLVHFVTFYCVIIS